MRPRADGTAAAAAARTLVPGSCFPDTVTQALRSEHPCYVCSSSSYFFHLRSAFAFHLQQDNAADYADDK